MTMKVLRKIIKVNSYLMCHMHYFFINLYFHNVIGFYVFNESLINLVIQWNYGSILNLMSNIAIYTSVNIF